MEMLCGETNTPTCLGGSSCKEHGHAMHIQPIRWTSQTLAIEQICRASLSSHMPNGFVLNGVRYQKELAIAPPTSSENQYDGCCSSVSAATLLSCVCIQPRCCSCISAHSCFDPHMHQSFCMVHDVLRHVWPIRFVSRPEHPCLRQLFCGM